MCKFSIIIPCYNSEKNINRLFDMMWTSDYSDYEVIYVDDCSKDNTFEKMQGLKEKYPNYTVVRAEKNGGPGLARNLGLELAKGEYILFCDSGDEFDISYLERISTFMNDHDDAQIVVFPHEIVRGNIKTLNDTYSGYGDGDTMPAYDVARGCGGPVAKVFKRSIIDENHIQFPDRMTGEDKCFLVYYSVHVKKAYKSNMCFYRYVMSKGSITHRKNNDIGKPTTFDILQHIYHEHFPEIEIEMFVVNHLLTRAKTMTDNKCSVKEIREFFEKENQRYSGWIDKVDFKNQSTYRKLIYKAMYKNKPFLIKFIMYLRRQLY